MIDEATLETLLRPFREQKVEKVYLSECCGRYYIGLIPATSCRTCQKLPENREHLLSPTPAPQTP